MLDIFKPWKLVAEMKETFVWEGGFLFPNRKFDFDAIIAFYEKSPYHRKIEVLGVDRWDKRDIAGLIEPKVYKWRDHAGDLPFGAVKV